MQTNDSDTLVPVFCNFICLERVGPERLRCLLKAPNIKPVRRHRDQKIVELQVRSFSQDKEQKFGELQQLGEGLPSRGGDASTESHDHETATNPDRCWAHRYRRVPA